MIERITPEKINKLEPNQIFVFGSNLDGNHAGGAAWYAHQHFGAVMGQGRGLQNFSYAIPTVGSSFSMMSLDQIQEEVNVFIADARKHTTKNFLVTPIGCGIAGFRPDQIAPMFKGAVELSNVYLPESFWDVLNAPF